MRSLAGKTLFITGASRGIGRSIALRAARDGANIAIASKTTVKHPKLPGTIHSAAEEIEDAGGQALAVKTDIRNEEEVTAAIEQTVARFGGLDILVNNASAIYLAGTMETPMKRYDLMAGVNGRGTFLCSQKALPHLLEAENPHILNISPPLSMKAQWFKNNCAYTMAKYGMSMCVLGMAAEFEEQGVAVNALWPRTTIDTAALAMLKGVADPKNCRKPEIVADAAHAILTRSSRECTGNFLIDDEVLRDEGVVDMNQYAVDPSQDLFIDFFLD
ncbi:MAG: NAD(P)-dependent oxidoreductase [bacterium]|nr:NAD(P)-dependent oxidoreductase [bacterium]